MTINILGDGARADVKIFAVCAAVLYVKFLATTMIQGRKAFSTGSRPPEDKSLPMAKGSPGQDFNALNPTPVIDPVVKHAIEDEMRWKRIVQNDIESIPMAFVVFWASIAVGANESLTCILLVVYTAARISHTLTFVAQKPLPRMASWMTGIACILVAGANGVVAAIK